MNELEYQNRDQQHQIAAQHPQTDSDQTSGIQMRGGLPPVDRPDRLNRIPEKCHDHDSSSSAVISEDWGTAR